MKKLVIPTVFARSKREFDEKFLKLVEVSRYLQIDFMDGKFVKDKGISLDDIPELKEFRKNNFEAHLMVDNPKEWIRDLNKKGFDKVIFHYQGDFDDCERVAKEIKKLKMEIWVAFNPDCDVNDVFWVVDGLSMLDGVMFMGVWPGKEGQDLIQEVVDKIETFKFGYPDFKVQVDGGVNEKTAGVLGKIGVDIINSGSFISNSKDPKKALSVLKKKFR